jgi:hypothetical protein
MSPSQLLFAKHAKRMGHPANGMRNPRIAFAVQSAYLPRTKPTGVFQLTPRKVQPQPTAPDLSAERAYAALSKQFESLQEMKQLSYSDAEAKENEWSQFTAKLIMRAFGSDSPNRSHFSGAISAGEHYIVPFGYGIDPGLYQRNYEARIQAYEAVLNSCLAELRLDLPEPEIQGVFDPGQEYEFYRTVKEILGLATREIFIIDPYLSPELFDVYAGAIPRAVSFRLLSANIPTSALSLAQKYASGGNFQFRTTNAIHDRVLFVDNRVWLSGQSLKDAAKKKPTYIVEHDEPLMRRAYEDIWTKAAPVL